VNQRHFPSQFRRLVQAIDDLRNHEALFGKGLRQLSPCRATDEVLGGAAEAPLASIRIVVSVYVPPTSLNTLASISYDSRTFL